MIEGNAGKWIGKSKKELVQQTQETKAEMEEKEGILVTENREMISDEVIIEIVHAFRDIIIEYIHRKY